MKTSRILLGAAVFGSALAAAPVAAQSNPTPPAASTVPSCNDTMNRRPVHNGMRYNPSEWRIGRTTRNLVIRNSYGVRGNPRSNQVQGYVWCVLEAGTPVAQPIGSNTGNTRIVQCGNPTPDIPEDAIQFAEVRTVVRREAAAPTPAPARDRMDDFRFLAGRQMGTLADDPQAAMERTIVGGVFDIASAATFASLLPKPETNVTQAVEQVVDTTVNPGNPNSPTPGDGPVRPGTPSDDGVSPPPSGPDRPVRGGTPVNVPDNNGGSGTPARGGTGG